MTLNEAIRTMIDEITSVLADNKPTIYLFGSVVLDDFKLGWSDIDIIVLTKHAIAKHQANTLVELRQAMLERYPGNPYFRLFEGGMLSKKAFFNNEKDVVVYWGTSGQRITDTYGIDSFTTAELLENCILICGEDIRDKLTYPTHTQFRAEIRRHYDTIRQHGTHGWGWLLDIARGIYTLRTGKITAKTTAGEWALKNGLCPVPEALEKAVEVRKNPLEHKNREDYQEYAKYTGEAIQRFADVLEKEISA
jgi:predicted nucleotidyltransferase